jgi:hypothetical protein
MTVDNVLIHSNCIDFSSYIVAYVHCRGNVFTERLPSNVRIRRHRLMGGIYEVRRSDGLRCHEFHEDYFRHSGVSRRGFKHTDSMEIA